MIIVSICSVGGYYGFAERIIDGMYLSINSVVVNFKATAFAASFQVRPCYSYLLNVKHVCSCKFNNG